jgi:hypothetical protein
MIIIILLPFLLYYKLIFASPLVNLTKRSPCDMVDAEPILYHEYHNDVCPPINKLNSDGTCPMKSSSGGLFQGTICGGYCEIRTTFSYGREQIFLANPYCHGPLSCTITDTATTTLAYQVNIPIPVKFTDMFSAGVTLGVSKAWTYAHAEQKQVRLSEGQCGYFTFLPIMHDSW